MENKTALYVHLDDKTADRLNDLVRIRRSKSKRDCLIEVINEVFEKDINKILSSNLKSEYEEE